MNRSTKKPPSREPLIAPSPQTIGVVTSLENRFVAITLVYAVVALTIIEYFGRAPFAARTFPEWRELNFGLYTHLWWACISIFLYAPLPMLIVTAIFKNRLRDYGLTFNVSKGHWLLYGAMALCVLPLVFFVSSRPDFLITYPMFRGAPQASLGIVLLWEVVYCTQFLALEFFFRGFLVLGLSKYIGRYAVWVALVPYCMIHYHKPPLEAFAAIVAGIVLGEVALRTRSIVGGVIVHMIVAVSMDALAIGRFASA